MPDLSKFNQENLFTELCGQRLQNFVSVYAFADRVDYEAQTPSVYPLGELHCKSDDGRRGTGHRWLTEDETIYVDADRDGIIQWVTEAY